MKEAVPLELSTYIVVSSGCGCPDWPLRTFGISRGPGEERTLLLLCRATYKFCHNGPIEWQRVRQAVPEIGTVAQCRALWRALAYDKVRTYLWLSDTSCCGWWD